MCYIVLRNSHPQNYTVSNQVTHSYNIHASECWIHIQLLQLMLIDISQLCEGTNDVTTSETSLSLPVVWMETFQARQTLFSCHKAEYTFGKLPAQNCCCSAPVLSDRCRRSSTANEVWRVLACAERRCGPRFKRYINLVSSTAIFCHLRWRKKDNRREKQEKYGRGR
jgi:hypothetical protein